jgi:ATP-dependent Lon protease
VEKKDQIGIVTGLAWTQFGGELLSIETVTMPGKGKFTVSGKLGDVMKESASAAISYVRSRAVQFNIDQHFYENLDIHIHVPEGATPKDGPSAGIAMCTAIVSALTKLPVDRTVAMTGEITLRGRVLPIGGLKEKMLAAHRGGIKKVLIPKGNVQDISEIPASIAKQINIIPVEHMDEVVKHAIIELDGKLIFSDNHQFDTGQLDDSDIVAANI